MKINKKLIDKLFDNKIKLIKKKDKIKLSEYNEFIPMYDIYSEKIYPIENTDLHFRLKDCHFRFITDEVKQWIENKLKKESDKNLINKFRTNLAIIENYDLNTLEKTSYETLYKFAIDLGLSFSICKRNSFHQYLTNINPYYTKIELIKLGKNNKIIDENANIKIIDKTVHYKICKTVTKNDISREEIRKSNLNLIKNNSIGLVTYYSFFGSYKFNNFLRNQKKENISRTELENIKKLTKIIKSSPKLKNDYFVYRFLANDDFLENLKIGDIFIDPGFLSTTRDPFYNPNKINDSFGFVLLKIHILQKEGTGIFAENFSLFKKEEEFILPPNSELKLISKDDNFKYFHTNNEFEKIIKKKYEFKLMKVNYDKIEKINFLEEEIPDIDLFNLELNGSTRLDLLKNFTYLTNSLGEFQINIDGKKFIFNYEWYDSSNTYSKFFYNKTKNGIIFINYDNGYPVLSIECGEKLVINYIKKYYHNNKCENLQEELIFKIVSLFGKNLKYKDVIIFPNYCNFINLENYKHKNENDEDYDILYFKMYCSTLYNYIKSNKRSNKYKYIELKYGYWKLNKLLELKVNDEINNKLTKELKNLTWKELFIKIVENHYYLYKRLENWLNIYGDNLIDDYYLIINIKQYLKKLDINYNIEFNFMKESIPNVETNKLFKDNIRII